MTRLTVFFIIILVHVSFLGCSRNTLDVKDSIPDLKEIYLADPTIFKYNDNYYLYGTSGEPYKKYGEGFLVFSSTDLKKWTGPNGASEGLALKKGDAFGTQGFWAPQIFYYQDKFYMFYTANEHIAFATSDSPLGPFRNETKADLKASVKQIDPFVFFDTDGKKYLYHVRLTEGNRIFVAELNNDLQSIKPETLKECIAGDQPWENTADTNWPVTEGPTVLKHKGLYYLIYSANDFRNPDYAVGYAISENPLGPWKKSKDSPIIDRSILPENGTGHGDIFIDKNGTMHYVLHTHFSRETVSPRKSAIIKIDFKVDKNNQQDLLGVEKESFQLIKKE